MKSRRYERELAGQPLERRRHLGADQRDLGAGGQEGRHPALGDVSAADDDDLAPGQHEPGQVGMDGDRRRDRSCSIVSGPRVAGRG